MLHVIYAGIILCIIITHSWSCKYDMNPLCLTGIMFLVFLWLFDCVLDESIKRDDAKNAKNDENDENE